MKDLMNKISAFFSRKDVLKISLYLGVILLFGWVYLLNILFPLNADDWGYSFIFSRVNGCTVRLHSVLDIFESQYNHYFEWGGRSVVHFIAQFLLLIDIHVSDLLNSLAYVLLFIMMYTIINKGKKPNVVLFVVLTMIMWLIQPAFSIVILWLTGSANYVWGALLLILFIYPYYLLYINKTSKDSIFKCVLFLLWGVISGWTNENSSLATIALLVILMCYLKFTKVKIPKWAVFGIIGACIGCAVMILAPGNQVRGSVVAVNLGLNEVTAFKLFKIRLYNLYNAGALRLSVFTIIYAAFLFLYLRKGEAKDKVGTLFLSIAFYVSGLIGFAVLYPVPYFPRDVWTGIHMFFLIAIGLLYVNIPFNNLVMKACRAVVVIVLIAAYINHSAELYKEVHYLSVKSSERLVFVEQEKAKGNKDIIISEQMVFPEGSLLGDPLSYETDFWTNELYAGYYNIHSIRLKSPNE